MILPTLWDRHEGRCYYCACKTFHWERPQDMPDRRRRIVVRTQPERRATREHLVRRADGGGNGPNIVLACAFCNHCRDERTVQEHKAYILALIAEGRHPNIKTIGKYKVREKLFRHVIFHLEEA